MKKHNSYLVVSLIIVVLVTLFCIRSFVQAKTVTLQGIGTIIIQDEQVLTGVINEVLIVSAGGDLTLLGMSDRDIIVEEGGAAYIYGIAVQNVLNRGGELEIYGVVDGYVHTDAGNTFIAPEALIVGTPPLFTPTPWPTAIPATPTPVATISPTPTPTRTPVPASGRIDLSISLYRTASNTDRGAYEEILTYFADAIYEMSNGAHKIRNIVIYEDGAYARRADVVWVDEEWPCAYVNGYGVNGYPVSMGDRFNVTNFLIDRQCAGYVLAHEWGHYYYGMYDEYRPSADRNCGPSDLSCPRMDDEPVTNSIMNNQWIACREGDFAWLNFSVPRHQTHNNAQYRIYNASAWETLTRPSSQDPRRASLLAVRPRTYFVELTSVAPPNNQEASIELLGDDVRIQSRSELNITWARDGHRSDIPSDTSSAMSSQSASLMNESYAGSVASMLGDEIKYPEPVIIVAKVVKGVPIAKADVRAGVLKPTGEVSSLTLRDDGIPPDVLANDGLYSGLVQYEQEGEHQVFASFNNLNGIAQFTEDSLEHAPGPGGEINYPEPRPVGENFYAVGNTEITLKNVVHDDHANVITEATSLRLDNTDLAGYIDYPADVDIFEIVAPYNAKLNLRVSDLAFSMRPRVQIWREDSITLIEEVILEPDNEQYLFVPLKIKDNTPYYVGVSHLDPSTDEGFYRISVGPALPNDTESPPFNLLFILLPVGGLMILFFIFLAKRNRPTLQVVSPPTRRIGTSPDKIVKADKGPKGSSIYKNVEDREPETEESPEVDDDK